MIWNQAKSNSITKFFTPTVSLADKGCNKENLDKITADKKNNVSKNFTAIQKNEKDDIPRMGPFSPKGKFLIPFN